MNGDALLKLAQQNPDVEIDDSGYVAKSKPQSAPAPVSRMEELFLALWHGPELEREYRFHDKRRWRFDFAHLPTKTAIEIDGGVWSRGRHNRATGFIQDCEKMNTAALDGWTVFRLPTPHVTQEWVDKIVEYIVQAKETK